MLFVPAHVYFYAAPGALGDSESPEIATFTAAHYLTPLSPKVML